MTRIGPALTFLFASAALSAPIWVGVDVGCGGFEALLAARAETGCCALAGADRVAPEGEDCCGVVSARGDVAPMQPSAPVAQVFAPLLAAPLVSPLTERVFHPSMRPVTHAARAPPPHLIHHRSVVSLR